jgi:glyoxylase-like metal-dependent hydrolase (beta-lactamase superfamily II)
MKRSSRVLAGVLAAACGLSAFAAEPVVLGDTAWLIEGGFVAGRQPDGNSVLLRGADGWIVVDSGRHAEHTQRIVDFLAKQELPLAAVVNTHWHLDHVSGNPVLRAAYPQLRVYASDAIDEALTGFLANSRKQLETMLAQSKDEAQKAAMSAEIARIDLGAKLRPDEVIEASGTRTIAGRELQVGLERGAATGGDVWLYDPQQKLLIAGDLVTLPGPFLDTACPPRWQAALGRLEQLPFETLVPGHGAPMTRVGFAAYRSAFDRLLVCADTPAAASDCAQGWEKDAADLLQGADPKLTRGLIEYYVQYRLRGEAVGKDCPAG